MIEAMSSGEEIVMVKLGIALVVLAMAPFLLGVVAFLLALIGFMAFAALAMDLAYIASFPAPFLFFGGIGLIIYGALRSHRSGPPA